MDEIMIPTLMREMIGFFQPDVKRINHALKVQSFAHLISKETDVDDRKTLIVSLAALLHDIGIKAAEQKYHSSSGNYQEIEGPPIAYKLLSSYNLDQDITERVCFIIGNHHSYSKIDDIDFQILVEADFLVNFFEESMRGKVIEKIRDSIFKTKAGIRLLEGMYLDEYEL